MKDGFAREKILELIGTVGQHHRYITEKFEGIELHLSEIPKKIKKECGLVETHTTPFGSVDLDVNVKDEIINISKKISAICEYLKIDMYMEPSTDKKYVAKKKAKK